MKIGILSRRTLRLMTGLLALLLLISVTGCGRGEDETRGAGHSFSYTLVGNPDTLDPQLAQNASAKTVLANLFEGLLVIGADGTPEPGAAERYEISEDQLHYTFYLRKDCFWYSALSTDGAFGAEAQRAVTAMDFVFAFQRLFDPVYNSPYREMFSCISNAQEISAGMADPSMIGVYARRDDELEITLSTPNADFLLLLTSTAALPCNEDFFNSTNGRYGLDEESVIGNGSFALKRWLYDPYGKYNVVQMVRNVPNHSVKRVFPADLSFYIEETEQDAIRIFQDGSADCIVTTDNTLAPRGDYSTAGALSVTLGLLCNPESPYGQADMREALAKSLDRTLLRADGEDLKPAAGIIPPAAVLLNKSCRELISDAAYQKFDWEAADHALQRALRKMHSSAKDEAEILVPAGLMDCTLLKEATDRWAEMLGITFTVEEISASSYQQRIADGDYTIALYAVTGDYSDAASVLSHVLSDENLHCKKQEQVQELLARAAAAESRNDCVEFYRQAEEQILSDNCFIPLFYKRRQLICKNGVSDVRFNAFSGQVQFSEARFIEST